MSLRLASICLGIGIAAAAQSDLKQPESLLNYSITGSSSSSLSADNAIYAMEHIEVQRLLLAVAEAPRDREFVETALRGSGVSLDDMLSNTSLRLRTASTG